MINYLSQSQLWDYIPRDISHTIMELLNFYVNLIRKRPG